MNISTRALSATALTLGLVLGCGESQPEAPSTPVAGDAPNGETAAPAAPVSTERRFGGVQLDMPRDEMTGNTERSATRSALFGDLHVHTDYSFDAYAFGTVATPYDAYRYAQGEAIKHPAGFDVKLDKPLDFYAVTDHAMFLGAVKEAATPTTELARQPHVQALHNLNAPENQNFESLPARVTAFSTFLPETLARINDGVLDVEVVNKIAKDAWADIVRAAEANYRPGEFTTFVAYEYTSSTDDRGNLHRNVIFDDTDKLPAMPFSRFHSQNPEGLWDWMDELRKNGIEALAIPHNANGSNGQMFKLVDWAGNPMDDAYAEQRIRNEPLIEITQVKGTSETHPTLSDTDEWADFEIMPYRVATTDHSEPAGSYARDALLRGLAMQDSGVVNPYQFGFVAASDTHTAAASLDESNFFSKVGLLDADGGRRGSVPLSAGDAEIIESAGRVNLREIDGKRYASGAYETWGASGLAGVWAEENTRESIYAAFRRKETFATSGPRIKTRLFGGYGFDAASLGEDDYTAMAYGEGVAMGSQLLAEDGAVPSFIAWAAQDPASAALQRLQIVKGWTVDGEHNERVYDVACSDGGTVDPNTQRCPDNGASVDLADCSITAGVGAAELKTVWQDPDFDPAHRAFYYVRVLENPTCRWSTWDAVRAGVAPRSDLMATIQERAWTSPIWYVPN